MNLLGLHQAQSLSDLIVTSKVNLASKFGVLCDRLVYQISKAKQKKTSIQNYSSQENITSVWHCCGARYAGEVEALNKRIQFKVAP